MKKLSIVIPVYNTGIYLKKCIDSIVEALNKAEILEDTQVIIINDGSTDNSLKLIEEIKTEYSKLIDYYSKENQGLASTKNYGLDKSNAEYISFIDPDDYISIDFYKDAFDEIKKGADITICNFESFTQNTNKKEELLACDINQSDSFWKLLEVSVMPSSCNKVVKKKLFNQVKFTEEFRSYEDLVATPILLFRASKISYINKPHYKYMIRSTSLMREKFNSKIILLIDAINMLYDDLIKESSINSNLNNDKIERLMVSVYLWRMYQEVFDKISKIEEKTERDKYSKVFLEKTKNMHSILKGTKYYNIELKKLSKKYRLLDNIVSSAIEKQSLSKLNFAYFIINIYRKIRR